MHARARRTTLLSLLLLAAVGCDQTPEDLREWRAEDHRHTSEPSSGQVNVEEAQRTRPAALHGIDDVALMAWKQNCMTCHGVIGRGDGPQGPMMKPPDLTDPAFHERATDAEIKATIKNGRGRMPAFELPESTLTGLVRLIRLFNRDRVARADTPGQSPPEKQRSAHSASEPKPTAAPAEPTPTP